MQRAPGQNYLKIAGIIYIISGAAAIVISIILIIGLIYIKPETIELTTVENLFDKTEIPQTEVIINKEFIILSWILGVISVISGVFTLFMGIMAVKYCDTLQKVKLLIRLGLINLILMIINLVLNLSWTSLIGCGIAVLYFMGAHKNNEEYKLYRD